MDAYQPTGDTPNPDHKHPNTTPKDSHSDPTLPAPATHTRHPKGPHRRRRVVIACCCLFLLSLFTLGLTILIHWLILQPKAGNYTLTDATLTLFNLTHNTNSSTPQYSLDADIDLKIGFNNPNKNMGFNIKEINVHTLYNGEEIGEVALPSFHQARRNDTVVEGKVRVTKFVFSEMVGGGLQGEIERSNITLQVVMIAKVRGDEGWYASLHRYRGVHLACWVSLMPPGKNGTVPGVVISKSCDVKRCSEH